MLIILAFCLFHKRLSRLIIIKEGNKPTIRLWYIPNRFAYDITNLRVTFAMTYASHNIKEEMLPIDLHKIIETDNTIM